MNFYKKKLRLVRLRYDTFREVLLDRSITWDKNTNRMIGDEEEWRRIFRVVGDEGDFCGDEVTASDTTSSEDGGHCMQGGTWTDSLRIQHEGEIEVIDLVTSSGDE
ncbi:UNVERIFIED_CONTAM: hypothetical protein Sindi_1309700 [Sesamum indicum]